MRESANAAVYEILPLQDNLNQSFVCLLFREESSQTREERINRRNRTGEQQKRENNRERLYSFKRIDKNNGLKNNREERRNKMNMTEEQQKRENNQEEWIEEQLGRKDQQVKVEKN